MTRGFRGGRFVGLGSEVARLDSGRGRLGRGRNGLLGQAVRGRGCRTQQQNSCDDRGSDTRQGVGPPAHPAGSGLAHFLPPGNKPAGKRSDILAFQRQAGILQALLQDPGPILILHPFHRVPYFALIKAASLRRALRYWVCEVFSEMPSRRAISRWEYPSRQKRLNTTR